MADKPVSKTNEKLLFEIVLHPSDGVLGCKVLVFDGGTSGANHEQWYTVRLVSQSTTEVLIPDTVIYHNELGAWCLDKLDY